MGADVGEGARRTAKAGVDAPVVVLGREQPVLEVRAVKESDGSGRAAPDALPRLPQGRVVAVDEGHEPGRARAPGRAHQRRSALGVDRERLLADDALPRRQSRLGERGVQVVRDADVDDVDGVGSDELLGTVERPLGAQLGGRIGRPRPRRRRHADQPSAGAQGRPGVDAADEAGPGDAHSEGGLLHRPRRYWTFYRLSSRSPLISDELRLVSHAQFGLLGTRTSLLY